MDLNPELSIAQRFKIEQMNRAIEATADPNQLQTIAKNLLQAWQSQRAVKAWVMRHQAERP